MRRSAVLACSSWCLLLAACGRVFPEKTPATHPFIASIVWGSLRNPRLAPVRAALRSAHVAARGGRGGRRWARLRTDDRRGGGVGTWLETPEQERPHEEPDARQAREQHANREQAFGR